MVNNALAVIKGQALTKQDVMETLDLVIVNLNQTGDMEEVLRAMDSLDGIYKVSGLGKAKLLWGLKEFWDKTGQSEKSNDDFFDYIESNNGMTKAPAKKYLRVWQYVDDLSIPKAVQESRTMDELINIATALKNDVEISKEDWKKIEHAENRSALVQILRELSGKPERKKSKQAVLGRDGSLNIYTADGKKHFVGFLEVKSDDQVVIDFIEGFVDKMHIQEK